MDPPLSIVNPLPVRLEGPVRLHELISGPETDAIALEYLDADGQKTFLSYSELHRRSAKLASRIQSLPQVPEGKPVIVPVYVPQCPSLYISLLAILKSGGAFCPLNLDVPEERLKFILKDTSAQLLLTTSEMRSKIPHLDGISIISVDEEISEDLEHALSSFDQSCHPDQSLAYIMYTSGSTGLPKAVCLSHLAVTQSLLAHDRHIPSFSRFLQFASPTFDVSVFEIFFPWYRGSTLVSCERGRLLNDLPGTITALNIDAAELTPSVAASLIRTRDNVPTLRTLLTIGEMLNAQVIKQFGGSKAQSGILYGMYGPTEAAIHCTLQPDFDSDLPAGTIGVPFDTVSCFVMKPAESPENAGDVQILPLGEIGELVVGGHQLANGYLNREEQTRAAFVSHPKYGNLYRTGDKARLLPSGRLECHGRISSGQVKLRGQRVELGEIEHAASKVDGCHAVIASVISGLLVVFCIVDLKTVTSKDIKDACRKWLPNYMIPGDVVLMEDFPYLPSGKTDKKKLESDYKSSSSEVHSNSNDVSESAKKLMKIIQSFLSVRIDYATDLGAAGLDSLKAISIASHFRKQGISSVSALDLLAAHSISDVERLIEPRASAGGSANVHTDAEWSTIIDGLRTSIEEELGGKAPADSIDEVLPCTPLQDAMLSETARHPQAYCNALRLALPLDTSSEQLWSCLSALSAVHPSLRSGFWASQAPYSTYVQVVWKELQRLQFVEVDHWNHDFSMTNDSMLLHPLRFQCKSTKDSMELLIQIHHALYDQWSIEIVLEDLSLLLQEADVSRRPSFGAVSQFFYHQQDSPETRATSMEFWQEYLAGLVPSHLPNLSAETVPAGSLHVVEHHIDMDMPRLREVASRHLCSPHVFFQAVYAFLLGLYMGTEDVTIGTVFSGRTLPIEGIEDIVGPVLSTLPSRINTAEARRFSDILRRLQRDNRQIMQNSIVPLAEIKKACGAAPGEPLFDSIFVWQETARPATSDPLLVHLLEARDYLEFNLTLELEPVDRGVKTKATFQSSILPPQHADILLRQLGALVNRVVSEPDSVVSDLGGHVPLDLLSISNPHPRFLKYAAGIGSVLERHAAESPERLALTFASDVNEEDATVESLTYCELNARANRLAHFLINHSAEPDQLICVCMEKSVDLYVSILAAVKTGAGYLPLVPETPPARVHQILTDAQVKLCLTDTATRNMISDMEVCHVLDVTTADVSALSPSNPSVSFDPSNVAYAVFTSGTTGVPKGVLVTQENILSNLEVLSRIYPVSEGSRLLQACNQAFDVSVFEIFFTWYTGMCLCSATKDVLFRDFEGAINRLGITHLSLTPTVAALADPTRVPRVKVLVTAGEAVTHQVHGAWAGKGLYQGYGPSETTNICTVNPAVKSHHVINNIGPAFENTSAFVLGDGPEFKILPTGSLGELCFGGQQVFRGYQNMPELTQSKILEHPEYGRVYRSGDLGRLLPDGTILIQGRTDDQRKLRGQRIELGEISSCLLQSSNVHDCAVDIVGDEKHPEQLVAFWIPEAHASQNYGIVKPDEAVRQPIDSLFSHLADNLPRYMIPNALIAVTSIPMTAQGKIDRRRLAADALELSTEELDFFSQAHDSETDSNELTETEEQLLSVLANTLKIPADSIGRSISFFALGLDSVSAIRFSTKLRTEFGHRIDVSQILKRPSIARLAMKIDEDIAHHSAQAGKSRKCQDVLSLELKASISDEFQKQGGVIESILPCTPLQEAMLSAGSDSNASSAYRNKTLFKLIGNITKIKSSWQVMVQRHAILRTAFSATESPTFPFVQVVYVKFDLPWKEVAGDIEDPSALLHPAEDDAIPSHHIPPWEIRIYRSGSNMHLLLDMHHALYDANAMSNLLQDVEQEYEGKQLAGPPSFTSFLDYMLSTNLDEADRFFRNHLESFLPKPVPRRKLSHAVTNFGCVTAYVPYSQETIENFLRGHSVTMLGLVQAAWSKVLTSSQNHSDICFGNVVSGRSVPVDDVQSLVAPCFNTIPVRVDVSRYQDNLALIKALQKSNVDALPYQLTPLRRIQGLSAPQGQRLFDTLVLLQQEPKDLKDEIWAFEGESGDMDFPCIVEFTPERDVFTVSLHFDREYLTDDTVRQLHHACLSAFSSCVRYPSSNVLDFVDFNESLIAGSLRPDEKVMGSINASVQSSTGRQDGNLPKNEPWTETELKVRAAYSAISSIPEENISRDMTIYRIGLDSISAIQVASRLRKQGICLQASDVMESPTCSELASAIQSHSQTPAQSTPAFDLEAFDRRYRPLVLENYQIPADGIAAVRPCTAVQSGMLSQFLHSEGHQYFNHTFYSMDFDFSLDDLARGWSRVAAEHEMLRTGFVSTDESDTPFIMLTYRDVDVYETCIRHSGSEFSSYEQAASKSVHGKLHAPLWRWCLLKIGDARCLQFSAHHALFDAETLRLLMSDLRSALNNGIVSSREGIDSALSLILTSSLVNRQGQQDFWSKQLSGAAITRFPNLSPVRVIKEDTVVVQRTFNLTRSRLETRCQEIGVSMSAVGQAAWARLLSAYTGEADVSFGVVFSGRTTAETADSPFPCITTLPVASNTAVTDDQLLQDLMSYNAGIQRHQFTPLTAIQKYAGLPNEALFDTLFAYQRPLTNDVVETTWSIVHETASVELAVSLEMESLPKDHLGLRLTINTAQVPQAQGEIMLHQMEEIFSQLIGVAASVDASALAIVPPKEPILSSNLQYLHELVEATVAKFPDRVAMEFVDRLEDGEITSRCWSYRQLDEEANRIAHLLARRGVEPGSIVATSFDKCPEASFAFYGVLKAGCAFCAIDPTAPTARKAFILQDSSAAVMLTSGSIRSDLQGSTDCDIVDLVNFEEHGSLPTTRLELPQLSPLSISYVLYTSGTTGTPKGCELTHENAVQALLSFQRLFEGRWTDQSRWLQFASYHFDVSVLEQFWTWSVAIRLVCAPRDLVLEDIMGFLDKMQITHLDLTPSLGRLLDPSLVPSLHKGVFITGGESLKQDMIDTWGDVGCLFNFYGPTEATIGVTTFPCVPSVGKPSNIGWQFDNVGSYVLAPGADAPVLRGAVGELCISGKLVGKGYLNRPELTDASFPYLKRFGERVYRTGDLVRLLHDGTFDFLGRKDNQVKLRGQRLEIDEIEAVIRRCPEAHDTVCLVAKHPKQQKDQLVAFVALSSNRKPGKAELCPAGSTRSLIQTARNACEEHLPGYMVPTHFLPIQYIPLSVNNKVEEKLLKQAYSDMSVSDIQTYGRQSQSQQPLSDTERKVAKDLADLLGIDVAELNPSSNVFALGLNSISAIQFSRRLKKSGFTNAQVAVVLKNPIISKLTKALSISSGSANGEITAARQAISACRQRHFSTIVRTLGCNIHDIEDVAPCTPLQQGIISRSLASSSAIYFNTFRYNAKTADLAKLRDAFQEALYKTPILRTVFIETDDGYVQVVRKLCQLPWHDVELESASELERVAAERRSKWRSTNSSNLDVPFEVIAIHAPSTATLIIHIHHALYDGNAFELLMGNVMRLYNTQSVNFGSSFVGCLPYGPLRITQGAKAFWLEHLSEVESVAMPSLIAEQADHDTLFATSLGLPENAVQTRRSLGVTLQALIQACWVVTLRKFYAGALGTVVSGRSIDFEGVESVIGPLFNTIPFCPRFHGGDSWRTLIQRCHEFNVSALPYQHTPLRDITKWCKKGRSDPLFDTLFVFQNGLKESDMDKSILVLQEDTRFEADYPLSFEAEETADGRLNVTIAAKASICDLAKAKELAKEFEDAFSAMILEPDKEIGLSICHEYVRNTKLTDEIHQKTTVYEASNFDWSPEALIVRDEMASLAAVQRTDINEKTSIFEVGLDSVDAVKLSSRLKKKGLALAVSTIMRSQTISKMISSLAKTKRDSTHTRTQHGFADLEMQLTALVRDRVANPSNIERVLPASPMQEALVSEMTGSSYKAYFNHDVLKISSDVDINKLEQAWRMVIECSPILRTGFLQVDDPDLPVVFAQIVNKFEAFEFEKVDLPSGDPFSGYLQAINRLVASAPLCLPQLRMAIATTSSGMYLIISIAHALYDGHSLSLLHQDVHRAYNGHFKPRTSYKEVLQDVVCASNNEAVSFWKGLLSGANATHLPLTSDATETTTVTHRQETASSFSAEEIIAFSRLHGVTIQAVCQTVWSFVLAHYAQSLDVLFGVVLAGRDSELAEEVMFPTMNTVVMRSIIHGTKRDMLQSIQSTIADISNHQHFPLRQIQMACQGEVRGKNEGDGLFNTLFTFQKRPEDVDENSLAIYESVNGASDVEYPVAVEAELVAKGLVWRVACKNNVFSTQDTDKLLEILNQVLESIVRTTDQSSLSFQGHTVSVCGLPAFQQRDTKPGLTPASVEQPPEDDIKWSQAELAIRSIISKVTKTPEAEIAKTATIQTLGVDSINAIKISALLRQQSLKIKVSDIIKAGSVAKIASAAATEISKAAEPATESSGQVLAKYIAQKGFTAEQFGYHPDSIALILPATPSQVYMLSAWQVTNGQIFFPEFKYQLEITTSIDIIRHAWNQLVTDNPILRTVIVATRDNDVPFVQLVLRDPPASFADLCSNEHELASEVQQPLVRLSARQNEGGFQLRLKIHHALYDAVSLPLLMQTLSGYIDSTVVPTSQSTFKDFIAIAVDEGVTSKRKEFWTEYLQGTQTSHLVTSSGPSSVRHVETFNPDTMSTDSQFEASLRRKGLSLQSVFFAAYAKAYANLTSTAFSDVVIGIYLANRSHLDDGSSLVAPTLNLVPLRVRSPRKTSIIDLALRVQIDLQNIGSAENSSVGLWEIARWTGVRVDTFVNFIKLPDSSEESGASSIVPDGTASQGRVEKRSLVSEASGVDFVSPPELKQNIVRDAYVRSLDIEATVANGRLAMGVFGWEDMIGLEQAGGLIQEIVEEIKSVGT